MMKKEHLKALSLVSGAIFLLATTSEVFAQSFVAPTCAKKYSFYPQGGIFFGDLFPNNFVDLDNSPGILDWHCGNYTYGDHLGIDTDILGFPAQAVGVPIFAVLDGMVLEAHDGEPDMNTTNPNVPPNYVKLDHGDGLTTSYLHMKRNSVAVTVGQQVRAGQQIGLTGSSGDSSAPHLHFQSEQNGVVFEPFAGPCRGGVSNWLAQPSFRTDLYLRELVLTGDNLFNWPGFPFDTSRTGTFLTGTRSVGFWCVLGNGDSLRTVGLRYLRPDGSVALAPALFTTNSFFRNGVIDFFYTFNLDVTGLWHLEISINNQVVASAPFTVIDSGPPVNHAPGGVQAAFDPPAPTANDVLFCRITSSTLFLDPDYDLPRFRYLWKVNGATVRDTISAGLADAIPRNTATAGDTVTCTITPSDGTLDGPSTVVSSPVAAPASVSDHLLNISTRLPVRTGDNVLIAGFIITGSDSKRVIIRGIGPSLTAAGVPDALGDPTLELHQGSTTLATNDNWKTRPDGTSQQAEIEATGIPPANDLESALVATLAPGAYTAILAGKNGTTGIGLVEVYDLAQGANSKLANISTRGFVDTGDNVMIGGFIIGGAGQGSAGVVVRGIGPSLASFGVANPLANPVLEIHDGNGVLETLNDDWRDCQAAEIQATGLQPTNNSESAVLATLRPGNYTAIVRGKNNTTGVALIEVYNIL
jgi:peptidase M23-like protein